MNRQVLRPVLLASAVVMFVISAYFFVADQLALGAALLAVGSTDVALAFLLSKRR